MFGWPHTLCTVQPKKSKSNKWCYNFLTVSDMWVKRYCSQSVAVARQEEEDNKSFQLLVDIWHALNSVNKQCVWSRGCLPCSDLQIKLIMMTGSLQRQASFRKQTTSTRFASVNKGRLFVPLCEGVWLATIMALAPACMITLTWGCFLYVPFK